MLVSERCNNDDYNKNESMICKILLKEFQM